MENFNIVIKEGINILHECKDVGLYEVHGILKTLEIKRAIGSILVVDSNEQVIFNYSDWLSEGWGILSSWNYFASEKYQKLNQEFL